MTRRTNPVLGGVGALVKSTLLLVGVPLSLVRLWHLAPSTPRPFTPRVLGTPSGAVHVVLIVVGVVWAWASIALVRELVAAVTHRDGPVAGTWSHRWAAAIAGLFLTFTAGSAVATTVTHAAPSVAVTARRGPLADRPIVSSAAERPPPGTVRPGECLADVAARVFGERGQWPAIATMNVDRLQDDGTRFVDPNLLREGWCLELPSTPSPASPSDPGSHAAAGSIAELAVLGLGIIATAAAARRLRSLHRLRESARPPGNPADQPPPVVALAHAAVDPFGDSRLIDWIEGALRLASTWGTTPPDVRLVRAGPFGVELLLGEPNLNPPSPMTTSDGGRWWMLDAALLDDPGALAPTGGRVIPWLVAVGEDADAVYLVAVGPDRHLVIDGAHDDVARAIAGVVSGLRTVPWADELDVELLGIPAPPAEERCYHLFSTSPVTLEHLASRPAAPPRTSARPTWRQEPLVVVDGDADDFDPTLIDRLLPVAGVISSRGSGTERLRVDTDGVATLEPYGIELRPPQPTGAQSALLDRLFAAASATVALRSPVDPPPPDESAPGPVDVTILGGPPEVVGWAVDPPMRDRERLIELLAYLVLHRRRSTTTVIGHALFGRHEAFDPEQRVGALVGAARALLPRRFDGGELIELAPDGVVSLATDVTSDWDRVAGAITRAAAGPPDPSMRALADALAGVGAASILERGASYRWFATDGVGAQVRATLIDGAHHLASLALASDDLELATAAVTVGSQVDPLSEIVARDTMVLADRRGDRVTVDETYRRLERALDQLASAEPSGETRALYRALTESLG